MDSPQITEAVNDVFIYAASPEHLRYRFKHCVRASVKSAVSREIWSRSLDDRLVDLCEVDPVRAAPRLHPTAAG